MKTKVLFSILFVTMLLAATIVVAGSYGHVRSLRQTLETIPLRDDCRKQIILQADVPVNGLKFLDDSTLVWYSESNLHVLDIKGHRPERILSGHSDVIQDFEISPDRRQLVSSSQDGTLRLWDIRSGECLAVSEALNTNDQPGWTMLHDLVYLRGGRTILTADMDGIKTWRARDLKLLEADTTDLFYLRNGFLSPDRKTVCVREIQGGFSVVRRKGEFLQLQEKRDYDPVSYSADGKRLLAADWDEGKASIWCVEWRLARKGQIAVLPLLLPDAALNAITLDPEGNQVATAHADGTVRIRNAHTGSEREVLHWAGRTVDGLCFSPHGAMVAAYSNATGEISYWGPFQWMI